MINRKRIFRKPPAANFCIAFAIVVCLGVQSVFAQAVQITAAEKKTADVISAEQLSKYLYYVAGDEMGGRDTPSAGLDKTAEYLKTNLQKWGFKPAGDNGTFFQNIELSSRRSDKKTSVVKIGDKAFSLGDDFFSIRRGTASGKLVFAKDGWMVKSKNIDAYSGIDVKGKIVVITSTGFDRAFLAPRPQGVADEDLKGEPGADWSGPGRYANLKGAAGLIYIAPPAAKAFRDAGSKQAGQVFGTLPEKLRPPAQAIAPFIPVVMVSANVGEAIFAGESRNADSAESFELNKTATVSAITLTETVSTQNVVALWEGSDPVLKKEMVAVGAHYDHVGTDDSVEGADKIWNGADDDGSGTVAVLTIAEALAKGKLRPKRSILLVWHAGEEKGLWGSEYFNKFPTVDLKTVVAQLNIDMIGRSQNPNNIIKCDAPRKRCNENLAKANEIYVIGSEMMSSTLGTITKATNSAFLKLDYNYKYDDPKDPEKFFFRSDHFNYAKSGIPIVFWFDGVHEDYHQPSDTPDKIDYQKMEKVTRTIFLTMLEIANLPQRPAVDKQLPPELLKK